MEKISININIPAIGNTYEFMVPDSMSIQDAQNLIIRILSSEYGISKNNTDLMLFDLKDNLALRLECSFSQLGLSDGARLLLI